MAECLNAAAKENLPVLFFIIDNGRAINTFTDDVAQNMNLFEQGQHYGVPGIKVDGSNLEDTLKTGRAVIDYVRRAGAGNGGPAMIQVHTYRFQGHSPADPEHERGRKAEKLWARSECDPIKLFEASPLAEGLALDEATASAKAEVKRAIEFAKNSEEPPADLAKSSSSPSRRARTTTTSPALPRTPRPSPRLPSTPTLLPRARRTSTRSVPRRPRARSRLATRSTSPSSRR